jgi:hypothetical protein
MASSIDICNMALSYLGTTSSITALTDSTVEAQQCNIHYAATRDALLSAHDWQFARKELLLLASTSTVVEGFSYIYQYPTDCLTPIRMDTGATITYAGTAIAYTQIEFEVRNVDADRVIVANYDELTLVYTSRVTNTGLYTPGFVKALALALAAELCVAIIRDPEMEQMVRDKHNVALSEALRQDQQSQVQQQQQNASWVNGR